MNTDVGNRSAKSVITSARPRGASSSSSSRQTERMTGSIWATRVGEKNGLIWVRYLVCFGGSNSEGIIMYSLS